MYRTLWRKWIQAEITGCNVKWATWRQNVDNRRKAMSDYFKIWDTPVECHDKLRVILMWRCEAKVRKLRQQCLIWTKVLDISQGYWSIVSGVSSTMLLVPMARWHDVFMFRWHEFLMVLWHGVFMVIWHEVIITLLSPKFPTWDRSMGRLALHMGANGSITAKFEYYI